LWFASVELLTSLLKAQIEAVTQLFADNPDLRDIFDVPVATASQRRLCFDLLAHRKIMEDIYEMFASRYEQSPSLGETEKSALSRARNLVAADAPAWVLEMNRVIEHLPLRLLKALPEALHRQGFWSSDPQEAETIQRTANALGELQLQELIRSVLDQQLQRLEQRWSANQVQVIVEPGGTPTKRRVSRRRDKQQMARDKLIAEIAEVAKSNIVEFLKIMDDRKVQPQPTWLPRWPGSWSNAYKDDKLRELIHKDKSRAIKRARTAAY
jgi:hypothetical protein